MLTVESAQKTAVFRQVVYVELRIIFQHICVNAGIRYEKYEKNSELP